MIGRQGFLLLLAIAQCTQPMFDFEEDNHYPEELHRAAIIKKDGKRTAELCKQLSAEIINAPDRKGKTVLAYAIEKSGGDIVGLILAGGADANLKVAGKSPLMIAVAQARAELIELLCMCSATDDAYTLFHQAIAVKSPETIQALAQNGFDINASDGDSVPLIDAVLSRNKNVVKTCLDLGADRNKCVSEERTAMSIARDLYTSNLECLRAQSGKGLSKQIVDGTRELVTEYDEIVMLLDEHEIRRPKRNLVAKPVDDDASCMIQ